MHSLTAEAEALRREIDELSGQIEEIPALDKQIAELAPQEQKLTKVSAEANEKKKKLDAISANIAASAVGGGAIERFHQSVSRWLSSLSSLSSAPPTIEPWPEAAGDDPLAKCRASVERARDYLDKAIQELKTAVSEAELHLRTSQDSKLSIENHARQLRKEIETLQEGAGAIVRQGQQLRERKAQLDSLKTLLAERRKALNTLVAQRNVALDRLDSIREQRFSARNAVATELTETLGPRIRVNVSRAGQFEAYAAAIADALRGSGLRYNELSPTIAACVSPRELLEAADTNDFDLIAEATGIKKDRAVRALAQLRDRDLGALATVTVEDTVALQLLDGTDYKGIAELSTGQRCAVVLPLVLRQTERVLIVDQPEDHIDNAFITDTLIASVLARGPDSQIIFSTHNANIPVLGNADWVIQLGSDGRRGFPVLASNLDDPPVVNSITTVMEGGADAFKRRATFYSRHDKS
ncbi:MAG: ATP-binding protein [Rhodobacteraceae bacterium]|nr:ATP-binding protein [Paracoccaceae bacterium]